jgi:hypothetical protein
VNAPNDFFLRDDVRDVDAPPRVAGRSRGLYDPSAPLPKTKADLEIEAAMIAADAAFEEFAAKLADAVAVFARRGIDVEVPANINHGKPGPVPGTTTGA